MWRWKFSIFLMVLWVGVFYPTDNMQAFFPHVFSHSSNCDARQYPISSIIIHSTEHETDPSMARMLSYFASPANAVSCHYLIDKKGTIYHIVDDHKRAWHAGISAWQDHVSMNHYSIGIELDRVSPKAGSLAYPPQQIEVLVELLKFLCQKHGIKPHDIMGHSDVSPQRKLDPGKDFPWEVLARHKLGCWVGKRHHRRCKLDREKAEKWLYDIGYRMGDFNHQILAFQKHFVRRHVTGKLNQRTYHRLREIAGEMRKARSAAEKKA